MKSVTYTNVPQTYAIVFLILMMMLLLSFIAIPRISLSSIATDFRWRKDLIHFYSTLRLRAGDRVFSQAVIGQDGWFFYTGQLSIPKYQRIASLDDQTLERIQEGLDKLSANLREEGKTLLVVIPPDKSTVYARYMPVEIPVIGDSSQLDLFFAYMHAHGNTTVIDLRPALIHASSYRDIYYKTDSHWNELGGYYAYVELLNALSDDYPSLIPHPLSDFEYKPLGKGTRDIAQLMAIPQYQEQMWSLEPKFPSNPQYKFMVPLANRQQITLITNTNVESPSLLVFHDSFYGESLGKFMNLHFSKVTKIPLNSLGAISATDWIRQESPDIVIIEAVERNFEADILGILGSR